MNQQINQLISNPMVKEPFKLSSLNWVTSHFSWEALKIKNIQNKQVDYYSDRLSYLSSKTLLSL